MTDKSGTDDRLNDPGASGTESSGRRGAVGPEHDAVLDAVQDAVCVFAVEHSGEEATFRFLRNNPAHEERTGLTAEEHRGQTPRDVFGEDAGAAVAERLRDCVDRREPLAYDETREFPAGTVEWRTELTPVVEDGAVTRVVSVSRADPGGSSGRAEQGRRALTERGRTLERIVERTGEIIDTTSKEETGQAAVDIAGSVLGAQLAGVHLLSDDGECLEMVAAMDEVRDEFGVPPSYARAGADAPSELVWDTFESGKPLHVDDTRKYGTLAEETPARSAVVYPLGDHGVFIVSTTVPGDFDEADRNFIELLAQTLTAVLDRQERKREIQNLKERLELAVEGADLGVWDWDMTTDEVEFNEQWATMLGYAPEDIDPNLEAWEARVHPDDLDEVQAVLDDHIDGDTPYYDTEHRLKTADGGWKWIRDVGHVVERAADGTPQRAVGVHVDIDERKRAELALEEQRDTLETLNEVVRHDIRNDLQVVTAYADLLADHVDGEGEGYVETLRDSAEDAVELTKTARNMAEVTLASAEDRHPVGLRKALENELDAVRSTYTEAAVTVDGPVPSVHVLANNMLDSVFRNLLKNAVQHNDETVPEVTVTVEDGDDHVTVRVADNGPGIPETQKESVFEKGEKYLGSDGTGVGLFLVRELVDSYGGEVRVEDNDPEGSVFVVRLPKPE